MKFIQVRHATCIIELDDMRFLIDPILYKKGIFDPIKDGIDQKNPLIDLSFDESMLENVDTILLTHLHYDHFDPEILKYNKKNIPVICSIKYKEKLLKFSFSNVQFLRNKIDINGVEIILTKGKHGSGIIGLYMGKSFGFVIKTKNKNTIYITGDTIWCNFVKDVIEKYNPNYIIGFCGSATINKVHITFNQNDVKNILAAAPNAKLVLNHMDAWNHCILTKEKLRKAITHKNLYIPNDGETIDI